MAQGHKETVHIIGYVAVTPVLCARRSCESMKHTIGLSSGNRKLHMACQAMQIIRMYTRHRRHRHANHGIECQRGRGLKNFLQLPSQTAFRWYLPVSMLALASILSKAWSSRCLLSVVLCKRIRTFLSSRCSRHFPQSSSKEFSGCPRSFVALCFH